ncbi:4-hydroxy-tetrahydrodipicolinate reductase [Salegentibacter agarivorans]|uniref:4-hydroxy-tetrahydrodipicolinate reductase n=1 Tax=Salegentibacter agarivorans TaxID=345907 RepID=A0A1I2K0Y2_9FLAO|nr:4-hydroxy-tetrahydrodipicolinate reductase [Salegentibacter agarivorans]SFF60772.1 dihydrodipicolinate reductase [Salegentibacter agarivorans]|tara:strand:+ start:83 stop:796 length:714 start_codon:yes stop_codon:yes gene_type:complete
MKIALLGYGKMGKTIEEIALNRGHEIVLKIEEDIVTYEINKMEIDVAIDFSVPKAAFKNITTCFENNIPVVCGTTGWLDDYEKAVDICKKEDSAFIYASNFSVGVNLFFELNKKLAKMMNGMDDYAVEIEEIHHTQKQDAPSGTAISLAQQVIAENDKKNNWQLDHAAADEIAIKAKRIEDVPGTHTVSYKSKIDSIEIMHTANSREGFALGAVIAAEWLKDKQGVFTMQDVLSSQF